jgi:hypothetical protein
MSERHKKLFTLQSVSESKEIEALNHFMLEHPHAAIKLDNCHMQGDSNAHAHCEYVVIDNAHESLNHTTIIHHHSPIDSVLSVVGVVLSCVVATTIFLCANI